MIKAAVSIVRDGEQDGCGNLLFLDLPRIGEDILITHYVRRGRDLAGLYRVIEVRHFPNRETHNSDDHPFPTIQLIVEMVSEPIGEKAGVPTSREVD
jgi:hypothetical protein